MALDWIDVTSSAGRGRLTPHGAHLVDWTPAGQSPVLFLSSRSKFEPGQAIRGGIPIIFPWFGDDREGRGRAAHGFARRLPWRVVEQTNVPGGVRVALVLRSDAATMALWPHAFELRLEATFGASLELALQTTNCGSTPFRFETALHTYFVVGDVQQVRVDGLDGARYLDKVEGFAAKVQRGEITFAGEVDRVYPATAAACTIVDPVLRRRIRIEKQAMRSTVVWNLGAAKALKMADLGEGEWQRFVCVESGNVGDDAVELAAGAVHGSRVRIDVAAL